MTNPLQVNRQNNIVIVKKAIAKSMPSGILEHKLRAVLSIHFGFSRKATTEYLSLLEDSGEVEKVEESEVVTWKLTDPKTE